LKWPYSCGFWCELAQQRALEVKKIRLQMAADNGFQVHDVYNIYRLLHGIFHIVPIVYSSVDKGYDMKNAM
jgi:hypothetical protein